MIQMNDLQESTAERLQFLEKNRGILVGDGDTHISAMDRLPQELRERIAADDNYFHGKPIGCDDLLSEMDGAGVDVSLVWQNPSATQYPGTKQENYQELLAANRYIAESAHNHPTRLIPAGWTDPQALGVDGAIDLARRCVQEFLFPVVKMNPAQNGYRIDSKPVLTVAEEIVGMGGVPAFHFGADTEFTPAEGLERIARHVEPSLVIAVHMGGGGASYLEAEDLYRNARAIGLRQPNIFYVLSAKRDTHMESDLIAYQLAGEPFCKNIACGSDAPYGRQSFNFGGFRAMFETFNRNDKHVDPRVRDNPGLFSQESVKAYLGGNLIDLVLTAYRRIGISS